jgi:Tfp pilus assembly protein PilF
VDVQDALLKAIDANPKDLQLYLALLRVSKLAADNNASQIYLNQILKKSDFSPVSSVIKGEAYLLCNKYTEADLEFSNAVDSAKDVQDCLYIGEIFVLNRQYDMAASAFYKVLNMEPENKKAKAGLNVIAKNKKIADQHYDLAKAYYDEGQKNLAIQELKKAISYNPKDKKSHLLLAKSYEKLHEYSDSLSQYQACLGMTDAKDKTYNKYNKKVKNLSKKVKKQKITPIVNL